jgi:exodeoxyribonuclease V beta subunit
MPTYTTVHDPRQIDLDRHGLIEASAGTGKTYTIENLVVRLLMEKPALSLENILLVTFTEKATCELKIRIRENLEKALANPDITKEMTTRMGEALEAFDTASIHTIHGFCHSLLKDFAFENNTLFQTELVDDRPLYEKALKEQMRSTWPKRYGRLLPELLSISGFTQKKSDYLETIIAIAGGGFHPEAGDRLQPDPGVADMRSLTDAFSAATATLKSLTGPGTGFTDGYKKLNFNASSRKAISNRILIPLEQWLDQFNPDYLNLTGFAELLITMKAYQRFRESGSTVIKPQKYNRGRDNSSEVCPRLDEVIDALAESIRAFDALKHILAAESIVRLRKDVDAHKRIHGSISYDDMLRQVHSALYGSRAGRLLNQLRERYHYAFIDEFQDTDPIQWQIFQRIFIESESSRLFLIGDPKQAIYSFRGADVFTYLTARFKLQQLADQNLAGLYYLNINYRSEPSLVEKFNRLFATPSWFGTSQRTRWHTIDYIPTTSPEDIDLPERLVRDKSGRNAFNLIDLRGPDKPSQANADLDRFIAREIEFLVTNQQILISGKNEPPRPLDPGDICILVRSRANAILIEAELKNRQIPYSYYRKPGLFASDEACYLSLVLHAALDPSDNARVKKALLTPFFRFQSDDLYAYDDLPVTHPTRQLFFLWHGLAHERRWGELFQSIMADTGLIFRETVNPDWDRMEANYNQITAYLNQAAYRKNLDFERMCAQLDGFRRQTITADETGDIHEIETEERKVQIMTMHQSKGLQFPVVFIGGGLSQGGWDRYHPFHLIDSDNPSGTGKVIDLTRTADPERYQKECIDEDRRLFYVALTRAQFKLYAPFFPASTRQRYFGPVCRFMAQAIEEAFSDPTEAKNIAWLRPDIHDDTTSPPTTSPSVSRRCDLPPEVLPADESFSHRTTVLESFSSIHGKQAVGVETSSIRTTFTNDPAVRREDDENVGLPDALPVRSFRPADEIPGGPEVGSMFHDILETIDFSTVINHPDTLLEDNTAGDLIDQRMALYGIDSRYRAHVAQVIVDTLTVPVPRIEKNFILGELKPDDRLHEVAFYYSVPPSPDRFIRGVVDLIFRYGNKYYIADWKSNRLDAGYDDAAMETSMDAADYRLQYRLYTIAALRWLKHTMGDRFKPKRHFGGVFYFYLRGMGIGSGHGIYYVPPDEIGSLASLEKEVNIDKFVKTNADG